MNFGENSLVHFVKQNNVGGAVDLPPTSCLRAVYFADHAAAHVDGTGRLRRPSSRKIGLAGQRIKIHSACPVERC